MVGENGLAKREMKNQVCELMCSSKSDKKTKREKENEPEQGGDYFMFLLKN